MRQRKKVYDNISYTYKIMNDAPYELDSPVLRRMQKLERALDHILRNLSDLSLTADECAKIAGYDEEYFQRVFRSYFGMPFSRFVTKLRIRQASRDIRDDNYPDAVGKKYGFSTPQSFSKAFSRELGMSPRQFYKESYYTPDMPFRNKVEGIDIKLEYSTENALKIQGIAVPPPKGDNTYLKDASAFVFSDGFDLSEYPGINISPEGDKVGIWWHEGLPGMMYIFGDVIERFNTTYVRDEKRTAFTDEQKSLIIKGGNYAVFSIDRPAESNDVNLCSRILTRFISKEWVPVNKKITDTMGCTYQRFTKDKIYEYVPLTQGMGISDKPSKGKWSIQEWADYIDEHINDDLNLEALAVVAGYSVKNYRDIFFMYYGVSPSEYIRRRRRYLSKKSRNDDEVKLPDLTEFYENNKERVKVTYRNEPEIYVLMHSIEESTHSTMPKDITGRALYWFHRDFYDFVPIKKYFKKPEEKIFIWGDEPVYENNQKLYLYFVGSVLRNDLEDDTIHQIKNSTDLSPTVIGKARYAVFSTLNDSDEETAVSSMLLLTRCAFGGYIKENRWRIDFKRRTFVMWKGGKLYFYVPIIR